MTLGEKIRLARIERKLTQEQLAGRDLTKSYVSELERGLRTPRLITLKVIARRLNLPISHFQDGVPEDREAEGWLQLGMAHLYAESVDGAQTVLSRALELATQQGDEVLQARIELALAVADHHRGRLTPAQRRLDRCLKVLGRTGDGELLSAAHSLLGRIRLEAGDAASALWAFQVALHLARHMPDDPHFLSRLELQLGVAHRKLGHVREAEEAFKQGLAAGGAFQDDRQVAAWHLGLADTAAPQGQVEQVFEHAGKALAIYQAFAHKRCLAELHESLAEIGTQSDRWEEAQHHYRWSLALSGAAGHLGGSAQTMARLALVILERGSTEEARAMCEAALGLVSGASDREGRAHVLRIRGGFCRTLGRREEARAALQESLDLFLELRRRDEIRLVRQELILLAIEDQDLVEARRQLQELREGPGSR